MKADVFIKYKLVFADDYKRISSEMEVFFFQRKEPHHHSQLIYLQIHYVFNVLNVQ